MICIQPDVIEKMPNNCADCVFSYYDEAHGDSFYCGISRFTVNKERKNKIRHKGCGIFDPDYGIEDDQEIEDEKGNEEDKKPKERTYEDIVEKAKVIRDSLNDHGLSDKEFDEDIGMDIDDVESVPGEEKN